MVNLQVVDLSNTQLQPVQDATLYVDVSPLETMSQQIQNAGEVAVKGTPCGSNVVIMLIFFVS